MGQGAKKDRHSEFAIVALGSNLPSGNMGSKSTLDHAVKAIKLCFSQKIYQSDYYSTPAFPAGSGPNFINAVVGFHTVQSPVEILDSLLSIEQDFHRKRETRWGARSLDLDLIAFEDVVLPDRVTYDRWRHLPVERQIVEFPTALILPHPRMQDRSFVLRPMCDIAPDWTHPVLGRTTAQLLADRPATERDEVVAL